LEKFFLQVRSLRRKALNSSDKIIFIGATYPRSRDDVALLSPNSCGEGEEAVSKSKSRATGGGVRKVENE